MNYGVNGQVAGIGQTTCNDHVSHKQGSSEQYALNLLWMQGFIDGVGYQRFITLGDDRLRPVYEPDSDGYLDRKLLW